MHCGIKNHKHIFACIQTKETNMGQIMSTLPNSLIKATQPEITIVVASKLNSPKVIYPTKETKRCFLESVISDEFQFNWRENNHTNNGKWFFHVSPEHVDEIWEVIHNATFEGKLGHESKVSTNHPDNEYLTKKDGLYCIFIYNQDSENLDEIKQSLAKLRKVLAPVLDKLKTPEKACAVYYKTNKDTIKGNDVIKQVTYL